MPRRLSVELDLADEPQDWGLVNGDGERLAEFIAVYGRDDLTQQERFEVAELVLASANDALEADTNADISSIRPFLPRMRQDEAVTVEYWERLTGPEFPLGDWLRANT